MSMFGRNNIKTQCFVPRKAGKGGGDMYALNIALKVNLKLGGANFALSHMEPRAAGVPYGLPKLGGMELPYMFIGADVTHPTGAGYGGENVDDSRSIAAVVASVDQVCLNTLTPNTELVCSLDFDGNDDAAFMTNVWTSFACQTKCEPPINQILLLFMAR